MIIAYSPTGPVLWYNFGRPPAVKIQRHHRLKQQVAMDSSSDQVVRIDYLVCCKVPCLLFPLPDFVHEE